MLRKFSSRQFIPRKQLNCKGIPIDARLAATPEDRLKGLMGIESLGDNEGCLLDFKFEQPLILWMRNVPIDLDVAYLASNGEIVAVDNMFANSNRLYHSPINVRYALEMPANFFSKHQIISGDQVVIL